MDSREAGHHVGLWINRRSCMHCTWAHKISASAWAPPRGRTRMTGKTEGRREVANGQDKQHQAMRMGAANMLRKGLR